MSKVVPWFKCLDCYAKNGVYKQCFFSEFFYNAKTFGEIYLFINQNWSNLLFKKKLKSPISLSKNGEIFTRTKNFTKFFDGRCLSNAYISIFFWSQGHPTPRVKMCACEWKQNKLIVNKIIFYLAINIPRNIGNLFYFVVYQNGNVSTPHIPSCIMSLLVGARQRPLWSPPWVPVTFGHCEVL